MTRTQIIAELRRSAMADSEPWCSVAPFAYKAMYRFWWPMDQVPLNTTQDRLFFLIVAEALG